MEAFRERTIFQDKVRIKIKSLEVRVIYRYNTKYEDTARDIRVEISLYDENVKEFIMKDNLQKIDLPLYVSSGLVIVKFLYYKAGLISEKTFRKSKRCFAR